MLIRRKIVFVLGRVREWGVDLERVVLIKFKKRRKDW